MNTVAQEFFELVTKKYGIYTPLPIFLTIILAPVPKHHSVKE
jgi:hypothetical protein